MNWVKTLGVAFLLSVGACDCNESAPQEAPPPPPGASATTTVPPLRCEELIATSRVKDVCGTEVEAVRGKGKWDCEHRFRPLNPDVNSQLVVGVTPGHTADEAAQRFSELEAHAKATKGYESVDLGGARAHSFNRTIGKGEGFRRLMATQALAGPYVLQVTESHHPDAVPVCEPDEIVELSKHLVARLSGAAE